MPCGQKVVCPFFKKKNPIHEAMYATNVTRYCDGSFDSCAVYQVIKGSSFLAVPPDLYPNQTFRVAALTKK